MFLISFTYIALCDQQYQVFAPAVEVGIVTARGGGLFTWSLPFSYFCLGVGGGLFIKWGEGRGSDLHAQLE